MEFMLVVDKDLAQMEMLMVDFYKQEL